MIGIYVFIYIFEHDHRHPAPLKIMNLHFFRTGVIVFLELRLIVFFKTSFRLPNCSLRPVNRNELITSICVSGDIYNRK